MAAVEDLDRLYDCLNRRWWRGQLPTTPVRWSDRMHALAGKYWRSKKAWEIVLSRPYHRRYPDEIEGTLKHEMVHVWMHQQGTRQHGVMHGPVFKEEAKRVGAPLYCHDYRGMHRPYRYEWECPNCKRRTRSRIRRDWACRACCERYSKGRYTAQFKLKLVQSEE